MPDWSEGGQGDSWRMMNDVGWDGVSLLRRASKDEGGRSKRSSSWDAKLSLFYIYIKKNPSKHPPGDLEHTLRSGPSQRGGILSAKKRSWKHRRWDSPQRLDETCHCVGHMLTFHGKKLRFVIFSGRRIGFTDTLLTLTPLTWRIWWARNNASKWQMRFN